MRLNRENLTTFVACVVAASMLITTWAWQPSAFAGDVLLWNTLLACLLGAGIVAAHLFPIHVQPHTKIHINTVPLFLMSVLLPIPFAVAGIGISMLIGQLLIRKRRGALAGDIIATVSRWVIIGYLTSSVARIPTSDPALSALIIFAAAFVMFIADVVTVSIQISPWMGESPWHLMILAFHESWIAEGAQYVIGILGFYSAEGNAWVLGLLALPIVITYRTLKTSKEMHDSTKVMLEAMADAVDLRDPYTGGHSLRVADLLESALKDLGIIGPEAELISAAARVHDIGKVGMPDAILNKEGPLTDQEWAVMRTHPAKGADLLMRYPDFARGSEFVRYHHERWNGSGYPRGLKETEIPLGARIIAVADALDAMTSNRPYRSSMTLPAALQILNDGRGKLWDARVVDAFTRTYERKQLESRVTNPSGFALAPSALSE